MKKRRIFGLLMTGLLLAALAGCGGEKTYADGTYSGQSEVYQSEDGSEEGNGYGVVTVTIENGSITDCTFLTYEPDGTLKDEDYGKKQGEVANKDFYNKAQKAVLACAEYASMLVANGGTDGIDAISGATINYHEFLEAADQALAEAEQ